MTGRVVSEYVREKKGISRIARVETGVAGATSEVHTCGKVKEVCFISAVLPMPLSAPTCGCVRVCAGGWRVAVIGV